MSIRRLFAPVLPDQGGEIVLDESASNHVRVLRLEEGERIQLFDGAGREAEARIVDLSGSTVRCATERAVNVEEELPHVALIQCVPKGQRLESIVRMATELGVSAIHLAESERVIARSRAERKDNRLARLKRIAQEAARQCGRARVPAILPPAPLSVVARRAPESTARLVFWEKATAPVALAARPEGAWLVVGPEGGLSDAEVGDLSGIGWRAVGLGRTILRVETAAPVALALVLDRLGELSPA